VAIDSGAVFRIILTRVKDSGFWAPPWVASLVAESEPAGEILFLSDLHLGAGADEAERISDLDRLFATLPGRIDDLVLGGDIFEFWWEWREAVPRRHLAFLLRLRELAASGVRIRLIAGNHDFAMGQFLSETIPALVHPDGFCLDVGSHRWLLLHGDGMARSDRLDRLARRILRSRWAQTLWNHVPADLAFRIAGGVGATSRKVNPGPAPNIAQYREAAQTWVRRWDLAGVVHGHTHRPLLDPIGRAYYANNGDWVTERSAVWIRSSGEIRLVDCRKEGHPWLLNT